MTIEELRLRKAQLRMTYAQLSSLSGVPVSTVQKILTGVSAHPRADILLALERVLTEGAEDPVTVPSPLLREQAADYGNAAPGRDRLFTRTDYEALPEDRRAELINGRFYEMSAPSSLHQELVSELFLQLKQQLKAAGRPCRVLMAPFDVQLDKDDLTVLQPDICVICDRDKITRKGCCGAPDMIIEILSDSTRTKDMYLKLIKYKEAGVREYWMVDPDRRQVLVYNYADGDRVAVYPLSSTVPVGISQGALKIDFGEILEEISYLL